MAKTLASQLEQFQIDFITSKVKELGGYRQVCNFYNRKDLVGAFAKQVASTMYDVIEDDEPEATPAPKPREKKSEKAEVVKKKRKINVKDLEE
jgi:hypothetical protein